MMPWRVHTDPSRGRVIVAPVGIATRDGAAKAIAAYQKAVSEGMVHFVGDCRAMRSFEAIAASMWRDAWISCRADMVSATFVDPPAMTRVAIRAISLVVGSPSFEIVDVLDGLGPQEEEQ